MRDEVLEQVSTVIFYCVKVGEIIVGRCIQKDLRKLMGEVDSLFTVGLIGGQLDV